MPRPTRPIKDAPARGNFENHNGAKNPARKGISPRLLALRLRSLEQQGLLTRTVFATNPPTTEYALTKQGKQLRVVIAAMAKFGLGLR